MGFTLIALNPGRFQVFRKADAALSPGSASSLLGQLQDLFGHRRDQLLGDPPEFPVAKRFDEGPVFSICMRIFAALDLVVRIGLFLFLLRRFGLGHASD